MLNLIRSLLSKKTAQIINLNDKVKVLCEFGDNGNWSFSYFILGSYGNYLLGVPNEIENFYDFFQKNGGIKNFLPWEISKEKENLP